MQVDDRPLPGLLAAITSGWRPDMQFFLYEILARVVAAYFCFDCSRKVWFGVVERRINYNLATGDLVDMFFPAPKWLTFERDTAPIRYWITVGLQVTCTLACLVVAILGWFHPDG